MRNTTKRFSMVLAMALAVVVMATPTLAGSALQLMGSTPRGNLVTVSVKNTSMLPKAGMVSVQAMVGGIQVSTVAAVVVAGGQTSDFTVGFTGTVSCVTAVSIQDSPVPM